MRNGPGTLRRSGAVRLFNDGKFKRVRLVERFNESDPLDPLARDDRGRATTTKGSDTFGI
jgi:hypothetical protein